MENPPESMLDLTVDIGIPGYVMRALIGGNNICLWPIMMDCLWIWLMMVLKRI